MSDPTQFKIKLPAGLSREDRLAIADEIIEHIVERTQRGKDKDGKRFPAYSATYKNSLEFAIAKQHGGKKYTPNLTLSGDMLAALTLVDDTVRSLIIGYDDSDPDVKARAEGNILGSYGGDPNPSKARDFLGIQPSALRAILAKYGVE